MYAEAFEYYRPKTVAQALSLLRKNKGAKVLAGGHSLLPAMKLRTASPAALVDIGRIKSLAGVKATKTEVKIGALTTHAMIAESEVIQTNCPILAETARQIGDVQVRNRGTIGGSLSHADPAADFPTVVMALGATLVASGAKGDREIAADRFFKDLFTTALRSSELLTTIRVPAYANFPGMAGAYLKHRHPASSYAVVGVAALVGLQDGKCARVAVVVGGATPTPVHLGEVEQALTGQAPTAENIAAAVRAAALEPTMGDAYASSEFRAHLAGVLAGRALRLAAQRAGA